MHPILTFGLWMIGMYVFMCILAVPIAAVLRIFGVDDSWVTAQVLSFNFVSIFLGIIATAGFIWCFAMLGGWSMVSTLFSAIGTIFKCMWDIFWIPFSSSPLR